MAVERKPNSVSVDPHAVALAFAARAQGDPAVERLWMFSYGNAVQLWPLTPDLPAQEERRPYGLLDGLYERFPEVDLNLHLLSPQYFDPFELDMLLPPGSVEIVMNAA